MFITASVEASASTLLIPYDQNSASLIATAYTIIDSKHFAVFATQPMTPWKWEGSNSG